MSVDPKVWAYHERTKHGFRSFAASPGYLDWATQPHPFRRYVGAPTLRLPYRSEAPALAFDALHERGRRAEPLTVATLGDFLRHALGLSAWKEHRGSRWSLRIDPSSGNLHPTECYLVLPALAGLSTAPVVAHYSSDAHVLETRAELEPEAWRGLVGDVPDGSFIVALASIAWREAWKYGERAFRYCQHDAGHALAALGLSASLVSWRLRLLSSWPTDAVATLLGLDRDDEHHADEPEEAELMALVTPDGDQPPLPIAPDVSRVLSGARWHGRANKLSARHAASWPIVDDMSRLTRSAGSSRTHESPPQPVPLVPRRDMDARLILKQRRSAVDMDGQTGLSLPDFVRMMEATLPARHAPWDAHDWPPCVHLALFVHRVSGLEPGLYLLVRRDDATATLRSAMRTEFEWSRPGGVPERLPLYLLAEGDARDVASRVSCDQAIAGDGAFSLGMLAELEGSLAREGSAFYRNLYWECGVIGQVLYLEAEAAGVRSTGIGCFYDDPVHDLLGLRGPAHQSLYHFTVGGPVEDPRLTTRPGYLDE